MTDTEQDAQWAAEKAERAAVAAMWIVINCHIQDTHIRVWSFYDAPEALRALSTHGGDEDWLALVPPHLSDEWIGWLDSGTQFGCCEVDETRLGEWTARIGAHA